MSAESERIHDPDPEPDAYGTSPETRPDPPSLLDQLREANEQLVVGSMRAQGLADEADVLRAEAEAANRLKDEFLAIVSHELRTPLNAILGWAQLLEQGQLNAAHTARAIQTIERNAKVLAQIIDDLLDVSRIIAGRALIELQAVDLAAVIQSALDEIRPAADVAALKVTFTCQAAPDRVAGDPLRLQQVFANLLSNAVKFTPPGGHIEVQLTGRDSEAEIRVTDTGQGIAAEFLPRIFDRFTQADASSTRRQGGLGLGLAIVKALVERHGGTVRAESPGLGRGATFIVWLPALSDSEAGNVALATETVTRATPMAPARLDGIRVLVVEDDPDGRDMLMVLLEHAGATVVSASSVREALDMLETIRPDVMVSDIAMADEDGYSLIRRIRARQAEHGGEIPAVALTGYVFPEDRLRVLAAGFQAHVGKPAAPGEIVAAVASVAGRASGASEILHSRQPDVD
jgi:signal transduction histidine kinase/ActR/RegA family two-component response regulator